ncbi:MAG: DUF2116 family Zn-ribbon domain-containing protein [Methanobacteriaceae archaeon]|nr:DUF2116 family Zn-ribbon domain-containing protein [Methanobacteriaceae archaeon]
MAVDPHKHCPVCGTPIPLDEKVCSPDCEKVLVLKQKQMKKSRITLFAVIVIFILVWAYLTFFKTMF